MITRRNIRTKVMQLLYIRRSTNAGELQVAEATKLLLPKFSQTYGLLGFQLLVLTEVLRYAERDAKQRAAKHLPTEEDMNVPVKIAGNELLWRILESDLYKKAAAYVKGHEDEIQQQSKQIYQKLTETSEYYLYNQDQARNRSSEKGIVEFVYNDLMLANELFTDSAESLYANWDDDAEMLQQIIMAYLQKPGAYKFEDLLGKDKEEFAANLLETTLQKHDHLAEIIKPKLKNWDPERLALLDTIILEMGVAEFLYFETIPPKVTINEYIDIAKAYSTAQSGQFVNGILDGVRKDLERDNRLVKTDFRKKQF